MVGRGGLVLAKGGSCIAPTAEVHQLLAWVDQRPRLIAGHPGEWFPSAARGSGSRSESLAGLPVDVV
jgi:hypothetical protein